MKRIKSNERNIKWNFIVIISLIAGVSVGAAAAGKIDYSHIISGLEQNVSADGGQAACFARSFMQNLKISCLFWIMGMTVIGAFFAPFLVGARGYAVGMSVGILIRNYGAKGLLVASAGILPHNLFFIPSYILMAILGIEYSKKLILGERNIQAFFLKYTISIMIIFLVVVIGCFAEGYISLNLIKSTL